MISSATAPQSRSQRQVTGPSLLPIASVCMSRNWTDVREYPRLHDDYGHHRATVASCPTFTLILLFTCLHDTDSNQLPLLSNSLLYSTQN